MQKDLQCIECEGGIRPARSAEALVWCPAFKLVLFHLYLLNIFIILHRYVACHLIPFKQTNLFPIAIFALSLLLSLNIANCVLASFDECRIFLSLMETAGLTELLKQEGSYTMFAPTDEAFEKLNKEDLELLKGECCQKIKKGFLFTLLNHFKLANC